MGDHFKKKSRKGDGYRLVKRKKSSTTTGKKKKTKRNYSGNLHPSVRFRGTG